MTLDLRGNGALDWPERGYSPAELPGDVLADLDAAGLPEALLVGHSMGGTLVQYLMARHRNRVRAAVLVAPVPASSLTLPDEALERFRRSLRDEAVARDLYLQSVGDPDVVDELLGLSRTAARAAAEQNLDTWRMAESAGELDGVDVPTLVVVGGCDALITEALVRREIVARLPRAKLEVVASAGHFIPLEAPQELARRIERFAGRLA